MTLPFEYQTPILSGIKCSVFGWLLYLKNFIIIVEDISSRTWDPDEGNAFGVGSQLNGALGGDGIVRVEHRAAW